MVKSLQNLRNPFVYQGYASPMYFCDRTEETEGLIANLQNGRNTVLISPRRIDKTGLIKTDKDIIYRTPSGYIVYDHFFALWLKRL